MSSVIKYLALVGFASAYNGFICSCNDKNGNNIEATGDTCVNFSQQGGYIDKNNNCDLPDGPPIQQQFLKFCQSDGKGGACVGEGKYADDSQSLAPPANKRGSVSKPFNSRILGRGASPPGACPPIGPCSSTGDPYTVRFEHGDSSCGGAEAYFAPTDGDLLTTSSGCSFDPGPYDGYVYLGGGTCGGVGHGLLQTMQFYDSDQNPIGQYDFTIGTKGSCFSMGAAAYYSWSVNNGSE